MALSIKRLLFIVVMTLLVLGLAFILVFYVPEILWFRERWEEGPPRNGIIANLVCSEDGSTVCLVVLESGDAATRLVRIRPKSKAETRVFELRPNLVLATSRLVVSRDGTKAFMTSTRGTSPTGQAAVALDLETGTERTIYEFDRNIHFLTQPEAIGPTGSPIFARSVIPKGSSDLSLEQTQFVTVEGGRVKVLTPLMKSAMWGNIPQSPRLYGFIDGEMLIGCGPLVVRWPYGRTSGALSEGTVLWEMPRRPWQVSVARNGVIAAVLPDSDVSADVAERSMARAFVHIADETREIVKGDMASLISISSGGRQVALLDLHAGRLLAYDVASRRLRPLPGPKQRPIMHLEWLSDTELVASSGERCDLYDLEGEVETLYEVGSGSPSRR